jgi:hypothetical protein
MRVVKVEIARKGAARAAWLAACLVAAACGASSREEVTELRTLAAARPEQAAPAADIHARFGLNDAHGGFVHPPMGGGDGPASPASPPLSWTLPAGWKELPATQMRVGNFAVPTRAGLECYVTVLPGGGGGLAANLNRWRKQMGQGDLSDAEIAALPRVAALGGDAALLLVEGGGGRAMAGVALERAGSAVFVKMTGASADVAAETANFKALCASLAERTASPHDGSPHGASAPAAAQAPDDAPFAWTAPEGWTQGAAKQMRLVTFNPKGAPGAECYVTVLGGAAGGLEANVNRWRQQLKLAPLPEAAIAALEKIPVLERDARFVEIDGGQVGMLGLVCELGAQTVFVKMTGPMDVLRAERGRFVEFCKSLRRR